MSDPKIQNENIEKNTPQQLEDNEIEQAAGGAWELRDRPDRIYDSRS